MVAYYNEFKPEAAHMLRQLIKDGLIAAGDVDERSITEVQADEIKNYTQCHFFAGIAGWSVALRLAGWDDSRPVWTGSCPCQPFSSAGRQKGKADERHLWPAWYSLIRELRPATVFGEQVERAIAHGWLDDVYHDMEAEGYAVGSAVLPACSVGKPHKRGRLWFVAHPNIKRERRGVERQPSDNTQEDGTWADDRSKRSSCVAQTEGSYVADTNVPRPQGRELLPECGGERTAGPHGVEWLQCPDGKQRPVEPGICLLAHGVQHRSPILHAFGNAIVPQVAAEFINAYQEGKA